MITADTMAATPPAAIPTAIDTPRLTLRVPILGDAPEFAAQVSDYNVAKMTASLTCPMPQMAAEFWIYRARASHRLRRAFPYSVIEKQSGALIGVMDIFNTNQYPEIGYWIGATHWGKGYASEAGRAIIDALAPPLNTHIIQAGTYSDNPGSGRVLEKLGFTRTGPSPALYSMARGCKALGWRYELKLETPNAL